MTVMMGMLGLTGCGQHDRTPEDRKLEAAKRQLRDAERGLTAAERQSIEDQTLASEAESAARRAEGSAALVAQLATARERGERLRAIIDEDGAEFRELVAEALSESSSDYEAGPEGELVEAACDLVRDGYCAISDFAEWGWTRSQNSKTKGQYFTYCQIPAPLSKHWAMSAEGVPVK